MSNVRAHMPLTHEQLEQEAIQATELLQGKVVSRVIRHRETEVLVEFTDQCRLFVERSQGGVELSITGGTSACQSLTLQQAYLAMFAFLENHYQSTGSSDIGAMLGSLSLLPDGSPAEPAHRREREAAIRSAASGGVHAGQQLES
jgi:hypothetical protein